MESEPWKNMHEDNNNACKHKTIVTHKEKRKTYTNTFQHMGNIETLIKNRNIPLKSIKRDNNDEHMQRTILTHIKKRDKDKQKNILTDGKDRHTKKKGCIP